jgi:hypothetical protein
MLRPYGALRPYVPYSAIIGQVLPMHIADCSRRIGMLSAHLPMRWLCARPVLRAALPPREAAATYNLFVAKDDTDGKSN